MRTFHVRFGRREFPHGVEFRLWLVDDDGREVSNEEVLSAFNNLDALGISVKPKNGDGPMGMIVEITDDEVWLRHGTALPPVAVARKTFHDLYELD